METKKAQAWGFDLAVGMVIFVVGIISFYLYTTNLPGASEETIEILQQDGELIAESLMSEGNPSNWNLTNVVRIGLLTNKRINQTKWDNFKTLANSEYNRTKSLFRIKDNYFVYIGDDTVNGAGLNYNSATNLIRITRVVTHNKSIKTLNIYAWN